MDITVSEFRKNTKMYMDAALGGERVTIERGGVQYELTANVYTTQQRPQVINQLPTAMPTTLEEANDPTTPGYSASVKPDYKPPQHYKPLSDSDWSA
jgi:hypothetical protein